MFKKNFTTQIIILCLYIIVLSGCSVKVSKRFKPDCLDIINNGNKIVLVLEPSVAVQHMDHSKNENKQSSEYLVKIVQHASITALNDRGYSASAISSADDAYPDNILSLKNKIDHSLYRYIMKTSYDEGLINEKDSSTLDENIGKEAIELGRYFNADLIVAVRYESIYRRDELCDSLLLLTIDAIAKSGITKQEIYTCYIVFIDAKTGDVIYYNALSRVRNGSKRVALSVSRQDLFAPEYPNQIVDLFKSVLPKR